jgi:hypothetical protein
MAEWSRTDREYGARVQDLLLGGGLNGSTLLSATTFHSNGGHNILTGGAGLDLFFGLMPADSSTPDQTDWYAFQGEVFVNPQEEHVGITLDLTALVGPTLPLPALTLDGAQTVSTSGAQLVTLQPGAHYLYGPGRTGVVHFTVDASGEVGYESSLEGILAGRGTTKLTVNGASVTICATGLTAPSVLVDYSTTVKTAAVFKLRLLPGCHLLEGPGGTGVLWFTVNPGGVISHPSSENGLLSLQGKTLIVKALA